MGAYLIDNPPRIAQFRTRTRPISGVTVVHTAESVLDSVGADTGAEAVARFIQGRTNYGSYHDVVDSDSGITLVPYDLAAFQDGTGSNGTALSLSFACRTTDWQRMSAGQRANFLRQGAKKIAAQQRWKRARGLPVSDLRRISRAQSEAGVPGFIAHGDRDPGRRTDPGEQFPWADFFAAIRGEAPDIYGVPAKPAPTTTPKPQEDDVALTDDEKATLKMLGDLLRPRVKGEPRAMAVLLDLRDHAREQTALLRELAGKPDGGPPPAA